jgi:hypothetical protein
MARIVTTAYRPKRPPRKRKDGRYRLMGRPCLRLLPALAALVAAPQAQLP